MQDQTVSSNGTLCQSAPNGVVGGHAYLAPCLLPFSRMFDSRSPKGQALFHFNAIQAEQRSKLIEFSFREQGRCLFELPQSLEVGVVFFHLVEESPQVSIHFLDRRLHAVRAAC